MYEIQLKLVIDTDGFVEATTTINKNTKRFKTSFFIFFFFFFAFTGDFAIKAVVFALSVNMANGYKEHATSADDGLVWLVGGGRVF